MASELYAFPFVESHADYRENVESLQACGIDPPAPALAAPTATQLREAMVDRGCASAFWPDAHSWFYWPPDDIYDVSLETDIDGVRLVPGAVGAVSVQFEHRTGGVLDWDGEWSDALSMVSFRAPDPGAALLVVWEVARRHGPVVVMLEGYEPVAVARGDESFGECYRAAAKVLFDEE